MGLLDKVGSLFHHVIELHKGNLLVSINIRLTKNLSRKGRTQKERKEVEAQKYTLKSKPKRRIQNPTVSTISCFSWGVISWDTIKSRVFSISATPRYPSSSKSFVVHKEEVILRKKLIGKNQGEKRVTIDTKCVGNFHVLGGLEGREKVSR